MNNTVNNRDELIPVVTIQKTANQRIVIGHKTFKGVNYIDVRLWVVGGNGEYVRTQRGISLRHQHLAPVIQGLLQASREVGQGGRNE